jgi:hypothetical protein
MIPKLRQGRTLWKCTWQKTIGERVANAPEIKGMHLAEGSNNVGERVKNAPEFGLGRTNQLS